MKKLTALDTAVLTLVASGGLSDEKRRVLLKKLSPEARKIATAILELRTQRTSATGTKDSKSVAETARALLATA